MRLVMLKRNTELADAVLTRPPRVFGWIAGLLAVLIVSAVAWAYWTQVDLIVRAPTRVRPVT